MPRMSSGEFPFKGPGLHDRDVVGASIVGNTITIWINGIRNAGHVGRSHGFVLAACLLALVFPVVSASDDLHALSAEIEESSLSGPSVKQWASSGCPTWNSDVSMLTEPVRRALVRPQNEPGGWF